MTTAAAPVRDRPMLMSGPMVRATLRDVDPKRHTRRVVKFTAANGPGGELTPTTHYTSRAIIDTFEDQFGATFYGPQGGDVFVRCPYGQPGDRLWVRENHWRDEREDGVVIYDATAEFGKYRNTGSVVRATYPTFPRDGQRPTRADMEREMRTNRFWSRRPSIHMPRWASRITLDVTAVRVERLQDISEADAKAEGIIPDAEIDVAPGVSDGFEHRMAYARLWDSLNARRGYAWDVNPWVWVIEFRRIAP